MIVLRIQQEGLPIREARIASGGTIGRAESCDVRLSGWRVAQVHARFLRSSGGVLVEDLGSLLGVAVDGRRIDGTHGPLDEASSVEIGPYRIQACIEPVSTAACPQTPGDARGPERAALVPALTSRPSSATGMTLGRSGNGSEAADSVPVLTDAVQLDAPESDLQVAWRRRVHARLLETIDLRRQDVSSMSDADLRRTTAALIADIVAQFEPELPVALDRLSLEREVLDESVGLGPLEALLSDDSVSEVMVNRHDQIYVERRGRLERYPLVFTDDRAVLAVIERIVAPLGRRIDESSPMVDARLKDGSRVHAVIPPLAVKGPCLTVRKFARQALTSEDLIHTGSISQDMSQFLRECVRARRNIVVCGGTGSGKTTLLNVLSSHIPTGERVITVEDAAELQLSHPHLVSLEARPPNSEGKGGVTIRDLVRNTLRMRPDRIVVGECRGPEALDMLQAMNTGHEGSLTTLHANSPRDALARLETLVLMAGMDLPLAAIREQVASAVNLIVQQTRFPCGLRAVTSITEITGMESGVIQMQELFRFAVQSPGIGQGRTRGDFTGCDAIPECHEALRAAGVDLDLRMFRSRADAPEHARARA